MKLTLDISQADYEKLLLLTLRHNTLNTKQISLNDVIFHYLDTDLIDLTYQRSMHQEQTSLLLYLTRYDTLTDLLDFLSWVDDLEELQSDLEEYQKALDDILFTSDEDYKLQHVIEKQEDVDNRLEEIADIKADIDEAQRKVFDYLDKYKIHNPNFDANKEIEECKQWAKQLEK